MLNLDFQGGCSPIGLDVGTSSVKMIQFARERGGELSVLANGQYALPEDITDESARREALIEGIDHLLHSSPFHGRTVAASLFDSVVQYKNVRLPQMPPDERAEAVRWEAAERFDLDDEARVDYLTAGEVRQGDQLRDELILMGVNGCDVRSQVEMLLAANLKPIALEPSPVSICRCLARKVRRESDQAEARVVVDLGVGTSKVIILRSDRVLFYKALEIGGRSFNKAVAERLDLSMSEAAQLRRKLRDGDRQEDSDDDQLFGSTRRENVLRAVQDSVRPVAIDLAKEIGLCLRYYSVTFRGRRPDHIGLIGGEAYDSGLSKIIGNQLELEALANNPLEGIDLSADQVTLDRRRPQAEWAVSAGLAMRQNTSLRQLRGAA